MESNDVPMENFNGFGRQQPYHVSVAMTTGLLFTVVAILYALVQCGFRFGSNRYATMEFYSKDGSNLNVNGGKRSGQPGSSNDPGAPNVQRSTSSGFINYFKNVEKFPFKSDTAGSPTWKTSNTIMMMDHCGHPSKTKTFFPLDSYSIQSDNDPVDTLIKISSKVNKQQQQKQLQQQEQEQHQTPQQTAKTGLLTKSKQTPSTSATQTKTSSVVAIV